VCHVLYQLIFSLFYSVIISKLTAKVNEIPISLVARPKACICGLSLVGIVFESRPMHDVYRECYVLSGRMSLLRADHSSRGVLPSVVCLECDREASIVRRSWHSRGCCTTVKEYSTVLTNWDTTLPWKDEIYLTGSLRRDGVAELILNPLNENPTRPSLSEYFVVRRHFMTDQNKAGFRRETTHLFCSELNAG